MHGVGTNQVTTISRSVPVLLDLTRLISRVGKGPLTGIDRVERAYLEWCLSTGLPLYSAVRTSAGVSILDRHATELINERLLGLTPWGRQDIRGVVGIKTPRPRGQAESDIRRHAMANISKTQDDALRDFEGFVYLNVGHSNLGSAWIETLRAQGLIIVTFVHDVIPLEHSEFQKPGAVTAFKEKLDIISQNASMVITNSKDTKSRLDIGIAGIVAPLGVDTISEEIEPLIQDRPYFVTLGTIEPRKNHALLLDIWEQFSPEADLYIIGQRGWNNSKTFSRLDELRHNSSVIEVNDMSDADMFSRLKGAQALLFPSLAEGFGLPGLEAASLGVPVICGDLAIHHETLGDYPVYADTADIYVWKNEIEKAIASKSTSYKSQRPHIPTWAEHFEIVDNALVKQM